MCTVGSQKYRILPLHSQIPREDQRRVFEHVPSDVTKVREYSVVHTVECCPVALCCSYSECFTAVHMSTELISLSL